MTSLQAVIDGQRDRLRAATRAEIESACRALSVHASVIGIALPDATNLYAVWAAHCRDMPGYLLASGLAEVLKHWTNTFCLPAPGAVWEAIEGELARMRRDLAKLEIAQSQSEEQLDPLDREPSEETERMLAATKRILSAAGRRRA